MFGHDKERIEYGVYTFYLKTGARISFEAENLEYNYSTTTGALVNYKIVNMRGECPLFVDVSQIAAITQR
jgi:tartrate dehydratase alpha subunit/fumarate hydratase class I-like protein